MSADLPFVLQEALHADSLKQKPTQQVLQAQKQMLDHLRALHTRTQQLLQQNEEAAEREQLPRGDMVVDVAGMGRLKALGDARVAAVREGILRAGLEQALVWERLKELGWDSMKEHQATLAGIKSDVEVWCFPKAAVQCILLIVPTMMSYVTADGEETFYKLWPANKTNHSCQSWQSCSQYLDSDTTQTPRWSC